MDLADLKKGDLVRTSEGAIAEVVKESLDGCWIRVQYVQLPTQLSLTEAEDLCAEWEILEKVPRNSRLLLD